jgi:hypothetical protein
MARFLRSRGLDARDYARLLDLSGDYAVAELKVQPATGWPAARWPTCACASRASSCSASMAGEEAARAGADAPEPAAPHDTAGRAPAGDGRSRERSRA